MFRVNVHDKKFEENTFSKEMESMFSALKLISSLYGEGVVAARWDELTSHQKTSIRISHDHEVSLQVAVVN